MLITTKKLLNFIKVEHTIFSVPLLFAGAWLGAGRTLPSVHLLITVVLAGLGARVFGMTVNRIADRKLDALNPRTATRELPSGRLSVAQSVAVALAGLACYLIACALLGGLCLALSPIPLIPLLSYSYLKRFTAFCHFGIGVVLAFAPLGAFVAASGHTNIDSVTWLLALFAFSWISGFDIIYALLDMESDQRTGVHSMPALLGARGATIVAGTSHLVSIAALAVIAIALQSAILSWAAFGVAAVAFLLAYHPAIPIQKRFFPLSAVAGVSGSLIPLLGGVL